MAAWNGHSGVAELLLTHGAEPEALAAGGATPLHYASQKGRLECVQLLIECGADKEALTADGGNTPLHLAAARGKAQVVSHLLEVGAGREIKNSAGKTALRLTQAEEVKEVLMLNDTPTSADLRSRSVRFHAHAEGADKDAEEEE